MAVGDVFIDRDTGRECTVVWSGGSLEGFSARCEPVDRSRPSAWDQHGHRRHDPDLSVYRPKSRVRI